MAVLIWQKGESIMVKPEIIEDYINTGEWFFDKESSLKIENVYDKDADNTEAIPENNPEIFESDEIENEFPETTDNTSEYFDIKEELEKKLIEKEILEKRIKEELEKELELELEKELEDSEDIAEISVTEDVAELSETNDEVESDVEDLNYKYDIETEPEIEPKETLDYFNKTKEDEPDYFKQPEEKHICDICGAEMKTK